MKVRLWGLHYKEYLCFDVLPRIEVRDLTDVLGIAGVKCYFTHENTFYVQHHRTVDIHDIAARVLRVIANAGRVGLDECAVELNDQLMSDSDARAMVDEMKRRAGDVTMLVPVSSDQIDRRGSMPSYWLKG